MMPSIFDILIVKLNLSLNFWKIKKNYDYNENQESFERTKSWNVIIV